MAIFPRIQSPCPYNGQLGSIIDGDMCRLCKRQVFDLSDMGDSERVAFMKGCSTEVCVSYKIPVAALAAAIGMAAMALPAAAAAQDTAEEVSDLVVTGGGIKDLSRIEFFDTAADSSLADLPVVYEAAGPATDPASAGGDPTPEPADRAPASGAAPTH